MGITINRFLITTLSLLFSLSLSNAQSLAASLQSYKKSYDIKISDIPAKNISGVTFHPLSKTLYVIDNHDPAIYEITLLGNLIRTISLTDFEDTEGIAYQSDNYFFIVEERKANCVRIKIPESNPCNVSRKRAAVINIADNWENNGLEGVAYVAVTRSLYLVKESHPSRLYKVSLDTDNNPKSIQKNKPFNIEGIKGDAAGISVLSDGNFLIVNQEKDRLIGYDPKGNVLSELDLDMDDPEGVTINPENNTIYVVGEPNKLYVFARH
jgi:uncharacterized protein YjiK